MNALVNQPGFDEAAPEPYRFTLDDVFKMVDVGILDEDERVELIEGELVRMSPQGAPHALAKMRLAKALMGLVGDSVEVIVDSTMRLAPITAPEPDLYLYPSRLKLKEVEGSDLLLLVEVAETSLRRDLRGKAALYAAYGVREYWVLDVGTRLTHVHRLRDGGYGAPEVVAPDQALVPVLMPGVTLRMADLPPFE